MSKDYCIYNGYTSRTEFTTCEQIGHTDQFQDEVYAAARKLCVENNYKTVLDIGCGSAFKLIKYFRDKKFVGLDLEPNLSHIKDKYPLYDFKHLVLSTPERGRIQQLQRSFGWDVATNGPPHNIMHIREWSSGELKEYLSQWFNIESQFMTPKQVECQVVIATPKRF